MNSKINIFFDYYKIVEYKAVVMVKLDTNIL